MSPSLRKALLRGCAIALGCAGCQRPVQETDRVVLATAIGARIETAKASRRLVATKERVHSMVALPRLYGARDNKPVWLQRGCPAPRARELASALQQAGRDGLRPTDYHITAIDSLLARAERACGEGGRLDTEAAADLELLLSDGFLIFASHLLGGRINPATLDPEWHAQRREADLPALLEDAVHHGVQQALGRLRPTESGYRRLQEALARLRKIAAAGGWNPIAPTGGPKVDSLKPGEEGSLVERLRSRLAIEGLLGEATGARFDADVEAAVRTFQQRAGLEPTGAASAETLGQLDVPVERRIEQLEVNLERWRWLPQSLGSRYLMAKIPSYELILVEDDQITLRMRAVVGKLYRQTPMFSSTIKTLVLNPAWQVPHKIAVRDIAKEMRKDPRYLHKKGITIHAGWDPDAPSVDPKTIAWSKVTMRSFKYRLRQRPGRDNALGRIKFMFPNKFDVYLHDTPIKHLFAAQDRALSSGCIRLEKALELAQRLFDGKMGWTKEKLHAALGKHRELTLAVPEPIPVHLTYFTAWVEPDGALNLRKDIYRRDRRLAAALDKSPPRAAVRAGSRKGHR